MVIDTLYAAYFAQPVSADNSNYTYSPDTRGKLSNILKRADGEVLNTYNWYGESIAWIWNLSHYSEEAIHPLATGDYVIEFRLDDRPFYRFPFRIDTIPVDGLYQPEGTRYFMSGSWNDYGNVIYQRNNPKSSLRFTVRVR